MKRPDGTYLWEESRGGQGRFSLEVVPSGVTFGGGPPFGEFGATYTLDAFLEKGAGELLAAGDVPADVIAEARACAEALSRR